MTPTPGTERAVLTFLALGSAIYFVARGLWWTVQPAQPVLLIVAIALFLLVVVSLLLWESGAEKKLPAAVAAVATVLLVFVPILANLGLNAGARTESFATWYIGAVGIIAVVCVVRRQAIYAVAVLVVLAVISVIFLGFAQAASLGLVGSVVWALVAQLLMWFGDRARRDTEHLTQIQQRVAGWRESQSARQYERRVRTQFALATAGPILMQTVTEKGMLSEDARLVARLAEGRLRDELRGASLLNAHLRESIDAARRRGVAVSIFDEGGLEGISEERRAEIREELAEIMDAATSQRVIIRSGPDPTIAVTVVGRVSAAGASDDDDDVDLWQEIPRLGPAKNDES